MEDSAIGSLKVRRNVEDDSLHYMNVRIGRDWIAEMDGPRVSLMIPRGDIRGIELAHGKTSERPVPGMVLGACLVGTALYMVAGFISRVIYGGGPTRVIGFAIPPFFLLIGGWLLYAGLRTGTYLWISTARGKRKVCFEGRIDTIELEEFLARAGSEHGYTIISHLPGIDGV